MIMETSDRLGRNLLEDRDGGGINLLEHWAKQVEYQGSIFNLISNFMKVKCDFFEHLQPVTLINSPACHMPVNQFYQVAAQKPPRIIYTFTIGQGVT